MIPPQTPVLQLPPDELSPAIRARIDVASRSLGTMSLQQRSRGHARALARFTRPRMSAPSRVMAGLAVAACLALGFWGWLRPVNLGGAPSLPGSPPRLSCTLDGAPITEDGAVRGVAASDPRPVVRFSDGTQIEVGAGARAHIVSLTENGASVTLDEGEVRARVVHWAGARWLFHAGPFVVTVTGTAFALAWSPDEERIDLRLENGSVEVDGPVFDQPIPLHSGKWLTVRVREREILIRNLAGDEGAPATSASDTSGDASASEVPGAPPATSAAEPPAAESGLAAAPAARGPARDWAASMAAGKFADVVEQAERWGIEACLAGASSSELSSLADAARYTKKSALSRRALLAQRERFAGSRRAAESAFLLGRLAESQEGGTAAVSWFDRYLAEAPSGPYAPEALGRKMLLVEKMSGRGAAARVAQEYLLRFPRGTYARAAGALLQAQ